MGMMLIVLLLNLGISFWNAKQAGSIWAESKGLGGWVQVLAWCAAIQSAIGFTYVYTVAIAFVANSFGYLSASSLGVLFNLMYLMIILPLLGTGLAITISSWIAASREKSLASLGIAGWNTFATAYNAYNAVNSFGAAFSSVSDAFGSMFDGDGDSDSYRVILLAAIAVLAGVVTTVTIMHRYEASLPVSDYVRNQYRDLDYR